MSVFFRALERRDWTDPPPIPLNSELGYSVGSRSLNLSTTEGAMQKVAISASVNLLASASSTVPAQCFSTTGEKSQIPNPKWLDDLGGDGHGLPDWIWQLVYSWALRGNAYAIIGDRDPQSGQPRMLKLIHPDDVTVNRLNGVTTWYVRGQQIDASKLWHRRIFPVPGAIQGRSPIAQHMLTIGLGLSAEQFGSQYFVDGGHPTALLKNTAKTLDPTAASKVKERFLAVIRGNREPLVLGADWSYDAIQITPNESQFLESNEYTNAECARIFGPGMPEMLGYETGGSMTYANIEQRALDLLTFTLDPWFVRIERVLTELMYGPQYVKLNRASLVRTDLLTRYRAHEIALRNEFEVVNEVRDLEDKPPVPWGDKPTESKTPPATPVEIQE